LPVRSTCMTSSSLNQTSEIERGGQGDDQGFSDPKSRTGPGRHFSAEPQAVPRPGQRQAHLTVRGLNKKFKGSTIYDDFSIDLPLGKFVSIFGPNGCGKSTLINMISGLMPMDAARSSMMGRPSATRAFHTSSRTIGIVSVASRDREHHYPLKVLAVDKKERARRVEKLLADFDVPFDLDAYPYTLSGGQQQTVSIQRALVTEPEVLFSRRTVLALTR